jgi:hypothetical protein
MGPKQSSEAISHIPEPLTHILEPIYVITYQYMLMDKGLAFKLIGDKMLDLAVSYIDPSQVLRTREDWIKDRENIASNMDTQIDISPSGKAYYIGTKNNTVASSKLFGRLIPRIQSGITPRELENEYHSVTHFLLQFIKNGCISHPEEIINYHTKTRRNGRKYLMWNLVNNPFGHTSNNPGIKLVYTCKPWPVSEYRGFQLKQKWRDVAVKGFKEITDVYMTNSAVYVDTKTTMQPTTMLYSGNFPAIPSHRFQSVLSRLEKRNKYIPGKSVVRSTKSYPPYVILTYYVKEPTFGKISILVKDDNTINFSNNISLKLPEISLKSRKHWLKKFQGSYQSDDGGAIYVKSLDLQNGKYTSHPNIHSLIDHSVVRAIDTSSKKHNKLIGATVVAAASATVGVALA